MIVQCIICVVFGCDVFAPIPFDEFSHLCDVLVETQHVQIRARVKTMIVRRAYKLLCLDWPLDSLGLHSSRNALMNYRF